VICAVLLGFVGPSHYLGAAILVIVLGLTISLDSSSLTAGSAGSADPARRGATLAVHSMLGYSGGFLGPLIIGWILDLAAGTQHAWGYAYLSVACLSALLAARSRPRSSVSRSRWPCRGSRRVTSRVSSRLPSALMTTRVKPSWPRR